MGRLHSETFAHAGGAVVASRCTDCLVRERCLLATSIDPAGEMEHLGTTPRRLVADEHLYWRGDALDHLFLVTSGCLKTYNVDLDGEERVRGFHFPGSLVGMDGVDKERHRSNCAALESTTVCAVSLPRLMTAAVETPALHLNLLRRMSRELAHAETLAGDYSARERVATFVLEITADDSGRETITLPMPRRDIAHYLRLATETVSRVLSEFRAEGLIQCSGRRLAVLDRPALCDVAEPSLSN